MAEDEVIEEEMIDLDAEADFEDDGLDLGDDDLLVDDGVELEANSHEIE